MSNGFCFQNFHSVSQPDSVNVSSDASSVSSKAMLSLDERALKALLEDCSRRSSAMRPLQECVAALRAEMNNLNAAVRQNGAQRYHVASLMEELQDATNGTYNAR